MGCVRLRVNGGGAYGERTRRVTGSGPAPATVKTEALIGDDLEETTATESLGVGLTLDLEDVEGEEDDLADADEGAGGGGHDSLAGGLAEGAREGLGVVGGQVVTDEGLAAVLVDTLEDLGVIQHGDFSQHAEREDADLVASGVAETGEEREELAGESKVGGILEDDLVEGRSVGNLGLVAHQPLRDGVDLDSKQTRSVYAGAG